MSYYWELNSDKIRQIMAGTLQKAYCGKKNLNLPCIDLL